MKPLIGIVARYEKTDDHYEGSMIPEEYLKCIIDHGGDAIGLITTNDYQLLSEEVITTCDGILFIGGLAMKDYHFHILNTAFKHRIPVLGICLGMQVIGCNSTEEKIIRDVEHHQTIIETKEDKYQVKHKVILTDNTKLYHIFKKKELMVNSRHRKQIVKVEAPYIVSARSEDGCIEAVELNDKDYFVVGVQWHPETLSNQEILFETFIKEALKHQTTFQK